MEIGLEDVLPGFNGTSVNGVNVRAPFLFPKSDSVGKSRHLTPLTIPLTIPLNPPRTIDAEA